MKRVLGIGSFALLLMYLVAPWRILAQATPGYVKINVSPVTSTSYTTPVLTNGAVYNFEVTAANAAGESTPSNIMTMTIPMSGTHTITLSWVNGVGGGAPTSYNVYDQLVATPNPPTGLQGVVN